MYVYQKLNRSTLSTRLLSLQADAAQPNGIRCGLRNVSLASQPLYFAISYRWSVLPPESTIAIDGMAHKVNENLLHLLLALSQFRWDVAPLYWVDALCIDQQNVDERNHQVQQMSRIYSGAMRVVVWLGPESDDSADVMSFLVRNNLLPRAEAQKLEERRWRQTQEEREAEWRYAQGEEDRQNHRSQLGAAEVQRKQDERRWAEVLHEDWHWLDEVRATSRSLRRLRDDVMQGRLEAAELRYMNWQDMLLRIARRRWHEENQLRMKKWHQIQWWREARWREAEKEWKARLSEEQLRYRAVAWDDEQRWREREMEQEERQRDRRQWNLLLDEWDRVLRLEVRSRTEWQHRHEQLEDAQRQHWQSWESMCREASKEWKLLQDLRRREECGSRGSSDDGVKLCEKERQWRQQKWVEEERWRERSWECHLQQRDKVRERQQERNKSRAQAWSEWLEKQQIRETEWQQDRHRREQEWQARTCPSKHLIRALQNFLSRQYWSRMWIIQEVLLATELEVVCGHARLRWDNLEKFTSTMQELNVANPNNPSSKIMQTNGYKLIRRTRDWATKNSHLRINVPLTDLVNEFHAWQCFDPRDKVYSLLGLTDDVIPIDYSLPTDAVFMNVLLSVACKTTQLKSSKSVVYFALQLAGSMGIALTPSLAASVQQVARRTQETTNLRYELALRMCGRNEIRPYFPRITWELDRQKVGHHPYDVFSSWDWDTTCRCSKCRAQLSLM